MPVYNAAPHLQASIKCVLQQSVGDLELIVVDDGSTDGGIEIVHSFRDPRIRVVRHNTNRGLAAARNTCLESAEGQYVAWLDADDLCHPLRLHEQLQVMARQPGVGLCGTWVKAFGNGRVSAWRYPTDADTLRSRMLFDSPFATSSVMVRRSILDRCSAMFDSSFEPAEDYDLWERLSHVTAFANIGKYLTSYRLHRDQTSNAMSDRQVAAVWRIQERQLAALGIRATENEKSVHLKLRVFRDFDRHNDWLEPARRWLEKLSQANEQQAVFPRQAFSAEVADRWYRVCRYHARVGLRAWKAFAGAPLATHYKGGLARRARLAICALCKV
jgi:glycosyltransferase involved in cell wall biosynthesis